MTRLLSDAERDYRNAQTVVSRCAAAGCTWVFEGTLADARAQAEEHRRAEHEWVAPGRLTIDKIKEGIMKIGPAEQAVLDAIAGGASKVKEIATARGASEGTVSQNLLGLMKKGLVDRVERGVYALSDAAKDSGAVSPQTRPAAQAEPGRESVGTSEGQIADVHAPPGVPAAPEPPPEPALPPAAVHAELVPVPVDAAPPGRTSSRLVQILSRLTSEDLEESADWYTAAIAQLEHERNLITQAIEAKAA